MLLSELQLKYGNICSTNAFSLEAWIPVLLTNKRWGSVQGNLCVMFAVLFSYASWAESTHFSFKWFLLCLQEVGSALGYGHFAAVVFLPLFDHISRLLHDRLSRVQTLGGWNLPFCLRPFHKGVLCLLLELISSGSCEGVSGSSDL